MHVGDDYILASRVVSVNMAPLTMSTHRSYHHGSLKAVLVEAGMAALDAGGIEGVSLREVARRCGVSHAAPLRHVPDHRALLTLLAIACAQDMHRHISSSVAAGDHPTILTLREAGVAYVDYARQWPARFRLVWRGDLIHPDDPDYQQAMQALWGTVMHGLDVMGGSNSPVTAARLHLAMAVVHGLSTLTLEGGFAALGSSFDATPGATRSILDLLGPVLAPPLPEEVCPPPANAPSPRESGGRVPPRQP